MATAQEWVELSEQWSAVFGEDLPEGFVMEEAPDSLLRKCIDQRSQKPLDDWIKRKLADGRVY